MQFKQKPSEVKLQTVIELLTRKMNDPETTPEQFANYLDQLERLYAMQKQSASQKVSRDTMAIVLGNLAGIGLIVGFERANVLTSKAINFVMKAR